MQTLRPVARFSEVAIAAVGADLAAANVAAPDLADANLTAANFIPYDLAEAAAVKL